MKKERTLYFKQLFLRIFLKRKIVLCWMLIFAFLLNLVACIKSYREANVLQQQSINDSAIDLSEYTNDLEEKELEEVDNTYQMYVIYQNALQATEKYNQNSILMQLNASQIPTSCIYYQIDNYDNVADLIALIKTSMFDDDLLQQIQQIIDTNIDPLYIRELVEIQEISRDDFSKVDTIQIKENATAKSGIMEVKIISSDMACSEEISKIVEKAVLDKVKELKQSFPNISVEKINQISYVDVNQELLNRQIDSASKVNILKDNISSLDTTLNENQKNYYEALIRYNEGVKNSQFLNEFDSEEIQSSFFHIKYMLIGAIIGLAVICYYYAIKMTFGKFLQVSYELEDYFELPLWESLFMKRKNNVSGKVDKWFYKLFDERSILLSEEEKLYGICSAIKINARNKDIHNVYITGLADEKILDSLVTNIANKIQDESLKITFGKSVLYDVESVDNLEKADGVILIEQIQKSNFDDIEREIKICREYNVPIIGSVAMI